MKIHAPNAAALVRLGKYVGSVLFDGSTVLVSGTLGAGKTTFAQGVARGLGVFGPVASPTYALVHEYAEGRLAFFHADVYRMVTAEELVSAGIAERVGGGGAWLVEWADRFPDAWPSGRLEVEISGEGVGRAVAIRATDPAHASLLARVEELLAADPLSA